MSRTSRLMAVRPQTSNKNVQVRRDKDSSQISDEYLDEFISEAKRSLKIEERSK